MLPAALPPVDRERLEGTATQDQGGAAVPAHQPMPGHSHRAIAALV
jgi:hypothetical protein